MKLIHTIMVFVLGLCTMQVNAQTMRVYSNQVITAIPSASAGDIIIEEGGKAFSVMGNHFNVADVQQIIVDRSTFPTNSVQVDYLGEKAQITVSADIAPQLNIRVTDAHVCVLVEPTFLTEVNYTLGGTSANGSFYMDSNFKSSLTLNNLNLTNPDSAAINIASGKRLAVNLPEGTTTTLTDAHNKLHKACFFVNGHAEFSGSGTLNLRGNSRHAYASDEYSWFKPGFGTLNVTSALGDGMHIEQYLRIQDGSFNISGTQGDCIDVQSKLRKVLELNGQAFVNGGTLNLQVKANDTKGLKCDSIMTISGGHITALVAGNGSKGISAGTDLYLNDYSGTAPLIKMDVTGSTYMPGDPLLQAKCRGIKVKRNFIFDGGNIHMTVTGNKAKGISVDGETQYFKGSSNVPW